MYKDLITFIRDWYQTDQFIPLHEPRFNDSGVMTRPIWQLMSNLEMYKNCQKGDLKNAQWLQDRIVNLPSSVRLNA